MPCMARQSQVRSAPSRRFVRGSRPLHRCSGLAIIVGEFLDRGVRVDQPGEVHVPSAADQRLVGQRPGFGRRGFRQPLRCARARRPCEPIVPPSRPVPGRRGCAPRCPGRDHSRPCCGRRPHQRGGGGADTCTRRGGGCDPTNQPTDYVPADWFRGLGGWRRVHRLAAQPVVGASWHDEDQGGQERQEIPPPRRQGGLVATGTASPARGK